MITLLFLIVALPLALAVAFNGGGPERAVIASIAGWIISDRLFHLAFEAQSFNSLDAPHLFIDGVAAFLFSAIAIRANRLWPILVASAQLIVVVGHISAVTERDGMQRAYWAMTQLPIFIQVIALFLGYFAHRRRFKRFGLYRDWRDDRFFRLR